MPPTPERGSPRWSAETLSTPPTPDALAANLRLVRERLDRAAADAGRDPGAIRLIAVSKTFPPAAVEAAARAGLSDFGENRVQEALGKIERAAAPRVRWHLIGHLQSNKARSAAAAFHWIHSVDSVKLLRRIEQAAAQAGTAPNLLLQVDLAGEETRHGAPVAEVRPLLDAARECRAARVRGLMLMPPWMADPEAVRPCFRRLRELRDTLLAEGVDAALLGELSMGMSHDFEAAIAEGATMVRVGTAIFGRRTPIAPADA